MSCAGIDVVLNLPKCPGIDVVPNLKCQAWAILAVVSGIGNTGGMPRYVPYRRKVFRYSYFVVVLTARKWSHLEQLQQAVFSFTFPISPFLLLWSHAGIFVVCFC